MKKLLVLTAAIAFVFGELFAGGLVTNTNQSAMFTRMQCRDATLGVDAAYFNPAGLTKLSDGFHLSLNNQTLGQTKTISSNYPFLSEVPTSYEGNVSAPLFPGIYAVYKTGKLAFSFGFNPIGGGGGAEYKSGLPSFEMMIADVVPTINSQLQPIDNLAGTQFGTVSGYRANIFFEGTSVYFGYQGNIAYELNDVFSVGLGLRYVTAKNTYSGYIKDVTVGTPEVYGGQYMSPGDYVRFVGTQVPPQQEGLNGFAGLLDAGTNVEADVEQTGSGITPIISLNISPSEKLNLSVKYEFKTKLELTNEVMDNKDAGGMFVDGETIIADMPAQLVAGLSYKPLEPLTISTGVHYYFDKDVDYDGSSDLNINMIDKNFIEYALGIEYALSERLRLSTGWLTTITGVNDKYQTDQSYSLPSNTFGAGLGFKISEMIDINLGGSYTVYKEGEKSFTNDMPVGNITEIYDKDVWILAVGLNFNF